MKDLLKPSKELQEQIEQLTKPTKEFQERMEQLTRSINEPTDRIMEALGYQKIPVHDAPIETNSYLKLPIEVKSISNLPQTKPKKQRGRPPASKDDAANDTAIHDEWVRVHETTNQLLTDFARSKGMRLKTMQNLLDRHRARIKRKKT